MFERYFLSKTIIYGTNCTMGLCARIEYEHEYKMPVVADGVST